MFISRKKPDNNEYVLKKKVTLKLIWKFRWQYAMVLPAIIFLFLFSYVPITGLRIAFKDYQLGNTIANAPWVGLVNFSFLTNSDFWKVVKNTLTITFLRMLFGFPAPIILAILLNEIRSKWFKRVIQSVSYVPHFVSWIVVAYIIDSLLSPSVGLVNHIIVAFGGKEIFFMGSTSWFRPIVIISGIWKEIGWGTIIYLAAITSLDQQLYEAAHVEGAGKWAQMRYVTLPGLTPTILLMLTLSMPNLLNAGYDQIYPLMNNINLPVSDVLDTFILRNGLQQGYYSMSSAVGLLSSVISLILMLSLNKLTKKISGEGLW